MRSGQKFERHDETLEGMELTASSTIDQEMRQVLTDEDGGMMRSGLLPKVDTATTAGSKSLLASINQQAWWSEVSWGGCPSKDQRTRPQNSERFSIEKALFNNYPIVM